MYKRIIKESVSRLTPDTFRLNVRFELYDVIDGKEISFFNKYFNIEYSSNDNIRDVVTTLQPVIQAAIDKYKTEKIELDNQELDESIISLRESLII